MPAPLLRPGDRAGALAAKALGAVSSAVTMYRKRHTPPPSPAWPMVIDVASDGTGSPPRPMTREEHRAIVEELILGLLDAEINVREWLDD